MTSKQIKDLINNRAKKSSIEAQILLRNYMLERFLERISKSPYRDHFVLKGGMLIAAMVGIDLRSTMDMDATIKGYPLNRETLTDMITAIIATPMDDGITIEMTKITNIRDESDYECYRISMQAMVDKTIIPMKVDITSGDAITPREVRYSFQLLLENRSIDIWAYPLETILAEKMETLLSRSVLNTRMRDFYDLHTLMQLQRTNIDFGLLKKALLATAQRRGTVDLIGLADGILNSVLANADMSHRWAAYQREFSYAQDVQWDDVCASIHALFSGTIK